MWVVNDARTRGKDGWTAFWWGLGTFMALISRASLWLLLRPKKGSIHKSGSNLGSALIFCVRQWNTRSRRRRQRPLQICDSCGKFYLGKFSKCPHCSAAIE
jgi:hypothetical protein